MKSAGRPKKLSKEQMEDIRTCYKDENVSMKKLSNVFKELNYEISKTTIFNIVHDNYKK